MRQQVKRQEVKAVVDAMQVMVVDQPVLVPMSAVAEVVRSATVVHRPDDPQWLHGWLQWRELEIPLVAYESLSGGEKGGLGESVNAVVINTLGRAKGMEFYAFLLSDLPRPARISEADNLQQIEGRVAGHYQSMKVNLENTTLTIPDLPELERFLVASL